MIFRPYDAGLVDYRLQQVTVCNNNLLQQNFSTPFLEQIVAALPLRIEACALPSLALPH